MSKHFLTITDFSKDEILELFKLTKDLKAKQKQAEPHPLLAGKTLAMIFQKPSARTRVSFEVGMFQLGGHALYLGPNDIGIGKREAVKDISEVFSRYVDIMMARMFGHEDIEELAQYASVPIVNGLTDQVHPCQIMADMFTIFEKKGSSEAFKICYIGDGNNVANSWINIAGRLPMHLTIAAPSNYAPDQEILQRAQDKNTSEIEVFENPLDAVQGADVVYTDVWASMGQESETEERKKVFQSFQVNSELMKYAKPDCIVMHCLPAHRGDEITDEVIDGPNSVVFDEAENRLHVQKAIMVKLMGAA